MDSYRIANIYDMFDEMGEDALRCFLSTFSCPKNKEIETFVKNKAIDLAKRKSSVTYFMMTEEGDVHGIFTLTHKVITLVSPVLSNSGIQRLKRYAQYDSTTDTYTASAFLIAQFGKNYSVKSNPLPGNLLMGYTLATLRSIQHTIGGGIVYLECEKRIVKLKEFYSNKTVSRCSVSVATNTVSTICRCSDFCKSIEQHSSRPRGNTGCFYFIFLSCATARPRMRISSSS